MFSPGITPLCELLWQLPCFVETNTSEIMLYTRCHTDQLTRKKGLEDTQVFQF